MANSNLIKKVFALSPHIEMISRRIYWSNINLFSKNVRKKSKQEQLPVDFNQIISYLSESGVNKGKLLLVHSAFAPLKGTALSPSEIVDRLLTLVGNEGTLAMPAMPKFKNAIELKNYLKDESDGRIFEYDVQKSGIKTGVLPLMMHKRKEAIRSRHPINTMIAIGALANTIMKDNLEGTSPLACGINSSWQKCVENDAIIVGLGTDLTHSLTMIHVVEDIMDEEWSVKGWYKEKEFLIRDKDFEEKRFLRERAPKWGALHFSERTLCKDLMANKIMTSTVIDGVIVEIIKSKELVDFLNSKNSRGYPYFWV